MGSNPAAPANLAVEKHGVAKAPCFRLVHVQSVNPRILSGMRTHTNPWYLVLSSYWFASSFKWFLILLVLLPARVAELVPEPERATRLGLLFALGAVMAFFATMAAREEDAAERRRNMHAVKAQIGQSGRAVEGGAENTPSSDDVGVELVLQPGDLVLQGQLAALEPHDLELVLHPAVLGRLHVGVDGAVLPAQFVQLGPQRGFVRFTIHERRHPLGEPVARADE